MLVILFTIQNFLGEKNFGKFPVVWHRHTWNYREYKNVFLLIQRNDEKNLLFNKNT